MSIDAKELVTQQLAAAGIAPSPAEIDTLIEGAEERVRQMDAMYHRRGAIRRARFDLPAETTGLTPVRRAGRQRTVRCRPAVTSTRPSPVDEFQIRPLRQDGVDDAAAQVPDVVVERDADGVESVGDVAVSHFRRRTRHEDVVVGARG